MDLLKILNGIALIKIKIKMNKEYEILFTKEEFDKIIKLNNDEAIKLIKIAYRNASKLLHPDVSTTDSTEEFQRLHELYKILLDYDSRMFYYNTGILMENSKEKLVEHSNKEFYGLVSAWIDQCVIKQSRQSFKSFCTIGINESIAELKNKITKLEEILDKLEYSIKSIKYSGSSTSENILELTLKSKVNEINKGINNNNYGLQVLEITKSLLDHYDCDSQVTQDDTRQHIQTVFYNWK